MKVTVVGCSPAWPNAGGAQSGYLVEGAAGRLLLDCGPGVLSRLREREAWPRLDAIAITHFHLDHFGDLVPWTWGARFGAGAGLPRPELWLPPDGQARLGEVAEVLGSPEMFDHAFELREYAELGSFRAAGFDVTPVRVPHYDTPTFALRVTDGSATVAYSADSAPAPELTELANGADLFLCEATLEEPEPAPLLRGHLTAPEAAVTGEGALRLLLVHRPEELALPPGLELARDGDAFELPAPPSGLR
jgi:ribonuclease BN (tRNA processing enzyme)